jgi:hypothetical protein
MVDATRCARTIFVADAALCARRAARQPASGDAPPSCVCKVAKQANCGCPVGEACLPTCGCAEDACLCKAPPEVLPPATA